MKRAITLIETLVYVGIASIILVSSTVMVWTWISKEIRQDVTNDVTNTLGYSIEQINYYTKRADHIDGSTIYTETGTGKLVLNYTASPSVTFDVTDRLVSLGDFTTTTQSLQITIGTSTPVYLTAYDQTVTRFHLVDLSPSPSVTSTEIFLELTRINPSNSRTYAYTLNTSSTVTLRSQ